MTKEYANYVSHLECSLTGESDYEAGKLHGLSREGRPLLVRYDLAKIKSEVDRDEVAARPGGFWKWRELLPLQRTENLVSLGEENTPLLPIDRITTELGVSAPALIKDEGRLPTGSFKARGLSMAISMAKEMGITRIAIPTNGNAGGATAAYANAAGMESYIFCPDDTPAVNIGEMGLQGAKVFKVNGYIHDCGKIVGGGKEAMSWFDVSTLKEPYRVEGKKTMGIELAAQLGWKLPSAIFYPTGGGTGLIGMWKAFHELKTLGWIEGDLPKMIAVQASGCAPIVKAYNEGSETAELWEDAHTYASGIRVPMAIGDRLILSALRESGGWAAAFTDEEIEEARQEVGKKQGILCCPEGASTFAAYKQAIEEGRLGKDESAVLYNCGSGLKYEMPDLSKTIDRHKPVDYSAL